MLRLAARRLLRSSSTSSSVRATVLRLADAAGSDSATNLHSDLSAKFELLTACEKEFGVPMPHAALNDVASLDDAVRYWETRVEEIAEAERAAEKHFTRAHPSNVLIAGPGRAELLQEWLRTHGQTISERRLAESLEEEDDEEMDDDDFDAEELVTEKKVPF